MCIQITLGRTLSTKLIMYNYLKPYLTNACWLLQLFYSAANLVVIYAIFFFNLVSIA